MPEQNHHEGIEVVCGKCGAKNIYNDKENKEKCVRCREWLYQHIKSRKLAHIKEGTKALLKSTSDVIESRTKTVCDYGKLAISWTGKQIPSSCLLMLQTINTSKVISKPVCKAIIENISAAYNASLKSGEKAVNIAAIFINALLASEFRDDVESWFGILNEGAASVYDKAVDAVYIATKIGGGHLHRLYDNSHTLWDMWDKVLDTFPNDSFLQEIMGYATALGKDLSSKVGIPLFAMSKPSYEKVSDFLSTSFNIPESWFQDLIHVNATELLGTSIGIIAVALNWNKKQVKEFSSLAGSFGISSIATANPALAILTLAVLAKSFTDAKKTGSYAHFLKGLTKGGIGTGTFLITSAVIGGPVWIGLIAGLCIGMVVHKTMDTVEISQVTNFMETSLRKVSMQLQGRSTINL